MVVRQGEILATRPLAEVHPQARTLTSNNLKCNSHHNNSSGPVHNLVKLLAEGVVDNNNRL